MRILFVLLNFFLMTLQLDLKSTTHLRAFPIASQVFQKLLTAEHIRDVQFITRSYSVRSSAVAEQMMKAATRMIPVAQIHLESLNNSRDAKLLSLFNVTSHTLVSYICAFRDARDFLNTEHFSYLMIYAGSTPKILVTAITSREETSFESILKHLCDKRIINLTIMELSEIVNSITVHHYNPFSKIYTKQVYGSEVQMFPDKLKNLFGVPIRIDLVNRPGQSMVSRNSQGYPVKLAGPDKRALLTLISGLNFTPITCSRENDALILKVRNGIVEGAMGRIQNGDTELLLTTVPYLSQTMKLLAHSYPFDHEKWCVVVPVVYDVSSSNIQYFRGIFYVALFIAVFRGLSVFLRFSSKQWEPLYVFAVLISTSMPKTMERPMERFTFLGVLLTSALYSTNLYADLAIARLQSKTEVVYKDFKELYESGLTPIVNEQLYDFIFEGDDKWMKKLKRKAVKYKIVSKCGYFLLKHRNVSCFMEERMAEAVVRSTMTSVQPKIRVNHNLCYWKPPIGYLFHKHSPYVDRFSDILLRMQESGIRSRWYLDYFYDITPKNISKVYSDSVNTPMPLSFTLTAIALVGYIVSLIIFLTEIIIHRVCKKLKNWRA